MPEHFPGYPMYVFIKFCIDLIYVLLIGIMGSILLYIVITFIDFVTYSRSGLKNWNTIHISNSKRKHKT